MKKYFAKFAGTGVLLCCLALCPAVQAFAEPDGSVIAARKKTWAKRGGEENDLASKSPVHSGDILNTNPVGRLQVLFRDDTVLMLAPSSQVAITGYIYAEDREPLMNLELAKGFVRLISGRLVEGHPGAMRVITPEATVGIQGTDAAITTEDGSTMVYGYQVSPDKPLLVMENATGKVHSLMNGMVFECFGDVNKPGLIRPMTDA